MKRILFVLFTLLVMLFFASLTKTGETRADGCSYSISQEFNKVIITFPTSQPDYSCHVDWGQGSPFDGPNSAGNQYSYDHDYSYNPGGTIEWTITINGNEEKITIDDRPGATGPGSRAGVADKPDWEPNPACMIDDQMPREVRIEEGTVNHILGYAGIMGPDKEWFTVDYFGLGSSTPRADDNYIHIDGYVPLGTDGVFYITVSNKYNGNGCWSIPVWVNGSEVSLTGPEVSNSQQVEVAVQPVETALRSTDQGLPEGAVLQPANGRWYAYFAEGSLRVGMTDGSGDWQVLFEGNPLSGSNITVSERGVIGFTNSSGNYCETDRVGSFLRGCAL